ncbi:hypothetical protein [Rathayibacter sp. AY1C5]|uniref:hypothetical protein n=1 Tax=Rathayibacter sp. AY1C5 TaxID=2080538 RepID=UPI0011AFD71D|nr:hypothetical protein [Rathayibacter sp. AY1C5]
MSEFKVGQKVQVRIDAGKFGTLNHQVLPGHLAHVESIDISEPYSYKLRTADGTTEVFKADQLERSTIEWDDLQVGDILVNSDGDEREVLGIAGKMIFLDNGEGELGEWDTAKYLQNYDWTIKQGSPADDTTELSVAEIETKLGVPAGTLRVKKD